MRVPASLVLLLLYFLTCFHAPVAAQAGSGPQLEDILPSDGWAVGPPRDVHDHSSFATTEGKYCVIRTTVSAAAASDLARYFDIYLHFFRRVFVGGFAIERKTVITVFGHQEELEENYRSAYGRSDSWTRPAMYATVPEETWVVLQGGPVRKTLPVETAKHELTHHVLRLFTGRTSLPIWFDEGTACFFQYFDVTEDMKTNIARNRDRAAHGDFGYFLAVLRKHLASGTLLSTLDLMRLDYDDFHAEDTELERLHYSESWALVNFLTTRKDGQKFFRMVLSAILKGDEVDGLFSAKTLRSLEHAWRYDLEHRILD